MAGNGSNLTASDLGIGELFDRVRDAVIVGDARSGQIVLWNEAAEAMFGYTTSDALGLSIEDLVPDELRESHRRGLARYATQGHGELIDSGQFIELPAMQKDGSRIIVEFSLTPMGGPDTESRFVMAILRDVTERRAAEKELAQAHAALSRALVHERESTAKMRDLDDLRTAFIATVADDISPSVTTILRGADQLREHVGAPTAEQQRSLAAVRQGACRLNRLAEDMLTTAALESGEARIIPTGVLLRDAVGDACVAVSGYQEVRCEMKAGGDLHVHADHDRLTYVLTTLISRVAEFVPAGSALEISARERGPHIEVRVPDGGPAIVPVDVPKLFQRFARIGRTGAESSGLALWVARELTRLMNGSLDYAAGSSAMFILRLPAA